MWEFGATGCHETNKTGKEGQDPRMLRGGITKDEAFFSDIKPQSSGSESFSKERELGKCLAEERFFSPQPPAGSSFLSLHRTSMQHWRQGDSLIRQQSVQKRCKLTAAITQDGKCQPPLQDAKSTHRKSHA